MAWVRRPYSAYWRLFAGQPDILTKGRYVVAPEDAPHAPFPHLLGSAIWTSDFHDPVPELGEWFAGPHSYNLGQALDAIPPAGRLGGLDCLANGATWPLPVIDRTLRGGFDSRCYLLGNIPLVPPPPSLDVRDCHDQQFLAQVEELSYFPWDAAAEAVIQARLPGAVVTVAPNGPSATPGTVIAVLGELTVVWVSGTTNFQQWALQAMFGVGGSERYGTFRTLPLWYVSASQVADRVLAAGADPSGHLVLVGHSYGGAVASILAVRSYLHRPDRPISVLTMGCPRPGNSVFVQLLAQLRCAHLVNDDDPVCYLPPSGRELSYLDAITPNTVRARWGDYRAPVGRIGLALDGTRIDNPDSGNLYGELFRIVLAYVTSQVPAALSAHLMGEYRRRIVCDATPAPSPPLPPVLWLRPDDLGGYALGQLLPLFFDASGNGVVVTNPLPLTQPDLALGVNGQVGARFGLRPFPGPGLFTFLTVGEGLDLGNAHSIYLVARCGAFAGAPTWGPWLRGPCDVRTSAWRYFDDLSSATLATPTMASTDGIWWLRRSPSAVELGLDGHATSTTAVNPAGVALLGTLREFFPATLNRARPILNELIVYNRVLDDVEHESTLDYLRSKYNLE